MIRVPRGTTRKFDQAQDDESFRKDARLVTEDLADRIERVANRASDKHDELTLISAGDSSEQRIPNDLDFIPNRVWCVRCRVSQGNDPAPYSIWETRDADEEFVYLATDAPEGSELTVRCDRV